MEILVGIGSFVIALLITVLSIKPAAGWLGAEQTSRSRCAAAPILAYGAAMILGGLGFAISEMMPGLIGLIIAIGALIAAIGVPIFIVARLLGTSGLLDVGIVLISSVVGVVIWSGLAFMLPIVLGIGLGGLGAMLRMDGMVPDEVLQSPQQGQVTTFTIGPCLSRLDPADLEAYSEMQAESGIPAEQLCRELTEDFDTASAINLLASTAPRPRSSAENPRAARVTRSPYPTPYARKYSTTEPPTAAIVTYG